MFGMNDTPLEVERLVREMAMARSGEERLLMGAAMFDAARDMVMASLPENLPPVEFRLQLFERIYGFSLTQALEARYIADDKQAEMLKA
jgi:hypothetical protein